MPQRTPEEKAAKGEEIIKLKEMLPHGTWEPFCQEELQMTARNARHLMTFARRPTEQHGVYVLKAEGMNRFKLGRTGGLDNRLAQIRSSSPVPIELLHFLPCEKEPSMRLEKQLHNTYANCLAHGEWFDLTDQQLASVLQLLS